MKKKLAFLMLVAGLMAGPLRPAMAAGGTTGGTPIDKTVAPVDFQETIDLQRLDRFSVQAVYSDGTPSSISVVDGQKSTATITISSYSALSTERVAIHTVFLVEGTDWTASDTATTTAKSLSAAILANSTLSAIMTSTWTSGGVVVATASVVGVNAYDLFTSTPAGLTLNGDNSNSTDTFLNGAASEIETDSSILGIASDTIRSANHQFVTGLGVLYTTAAVAIGGLTDQTTYYVIKTDLQDFQLATTTTTAAAGTAVDITSLTGGGTFTFGPVALSGVPSFKWEASNDNSNWSDVAVSSVTWSASGSTLWDYAEVGYRYLRLNYYHPSAGSGGLALVIHLFGRLDD